ncbi:hypothetical protein [Ord River virus]|uniref:Uncharacterized protein n=1 Tax=Ord River virus TaxID=1620895 RepID=A0A0D3R2B9_9RHAB|nr:hypothetical protein [Ord River virus]AJR28602.1 hypothetical protein [Ord River virus]ASM90786.1 hypothetical protein [Ord River virus]
MATTNLNKRLTRRVYFRLDWYGDNLKDVDVIKLFKLTIESEDVLELVKDMMVEDLIRTCRKSFYDFVWPTHHRLVGGSAFFGPCPENLIELLKDDISIKLDETGMFRKSPFTLTMEIDYNLDEDTKECESQSPNNSRPPHLQF